MAGGGLLRLLRGALILALFLASLAKLWPPDPFPPLDPRPPPKGGGDAARGGADGAHPPPAGAAPPSPPPEPEPTPTPEAPAPVIVAERPPAVRAGMLRRARALRERVEAGQGKRATKFKRRSAQRRVDILEVLAEKLPKIGDGGRGSVLKRWQGPTPDPDRPLSVPHQNRRFSRIQGMECPDEFNRTLFGEVWDRAEGDEDWVKWYRLFERRVQEHGANPRANGLALDAPRILRLTGPLQLFQTATVADIGCGNGHFLSTVLKYYHLQVIAVDPLSQFTDLARSALQPAFVCQASVMDLTFIPTESVDRVICNEVLNFLSVRTSLLAVEEMLRILKPGGILMLGLLHHEFPDIKLTNHGLNVFEANYPVMLWKFVAAKLGLKPPLLFDAQDALGKEQGREHYSVFLEKTSL